MRRRTVSRRLADYATTVESAALAGEGQPRAICLVVASDLFTRLNAADSHIHEVAGDRIVVAGMIDEALWAFDHEEFVGVKRVKMRVRVLLISS